MTDTIIWHNPRCSKSRDTLALLRARGESPEVRLYLDAPPSAAELRAVLAQLGIPARDLMRRKEPLYAELGLATKSDAEMLQAMIDHPVLIERPVVIHAGRAAIGRPPERVLELFGKD